MDAPGTGPIFVSCSGGDIEDQTLRMRTCDGPAHSRRHACDLRRARVCAGAPERNAGLAGRGVGPAVLHLRRGAPRRRPVVGEDCGSGRRALLPTVCVCGGAPRRR